MSRASRKRSRNATSSLPLPSVANLPNVVSLREALAARIDCIPASWRDAASAAGISGIDPFLCHLGRCVNAALHALPESAEAARLSLRILRSSLHDAIDARCNELECRINSSEAAKVAALERELVTIDAALERWRSDGTAVGAALASLSDTDLVVQQATLTSRLDDLETQLMALSTSAVELPVVGLTADMPTVMSSLTGFGRVLSPSPITAADLTLQGVPTHASPGCSLTLCFVPQGAVHASQSAEELEVALRATVATLRVDACLRTTDDTVLNLQSVITLDVATRTVIISVAVPASAPAGASVCVASVRVAGKCVVGGLSVKVRCGMSTPLRRPIANLDVCSTPCISRCGTLFAPNCGSANVHVFSADGSTLPGIPVAKLGLTNMTWVSAFTDGEHPSLLLADDGSKVSSRLVSIDPVTHAVRWATSTNSSKYAGIAALPAHGVVIVADKSNEE